MNLRLTPRDIAYSGLFGAAALLLPMLFHLVHLGRVFMPMYLPLVALAFYVRPLAAATTSGVTPLLSALITGMPPFVPPVAVMMSIELAIMATIIAWIVSRWPGIRELWVLLGVLLLGRAIYVGLVYAFSLVLSLPGAFLATVSLLSGWPGVLLMLVVIPPLVSATKTHAAPSMIPEKRAT